MRQSSISLDGVLHTHIQKHHLQDASCVNAPPITGPMQTLMPKTLVTSPMYIGLFCSGTVSATMFRAPWKRPAAPTPAIARPRMKTAELGAAAHITEPTVDLLVYCIEEGKYYDIGLLTHLRR